MKICYKIFTLGAIIATFATGSAKGACEYYEDASGNFQCCEACPTGTYATADLCKSAGNADGCLIVASTGCYRPYTCADIKVEVTESSKTTTISKLSALNDSGFDEMLKYYIGSDKWGIYDLKSSASSAVYKYGSKTIKTTSSTSLKINNTECYYLSKIDYVKGKKLDYLTLDSGNTVLVTSGSAATIKTAENSCFKNDTSVCKSGYYGVTIGAVDNNNIVLRSQSGLVSYPTSSTSTTSDPNRYIATVSELDAMNTAFNIKLLKSNGIELTQASGDVLWNDTNTCYWAIPDDSRDKDYPDIILYAFGRTNTVQNVRISGGTGCYSVCPTDNETVYCGYDANKSYNGMAMAGQTSICPTTDYKDSNNDCHAPWDDMSGENGNPAQDVKAGYRIESWNLKTLTNSKCGKYMKCKQLIISILP